MCAGKSLILGHNMAHIMSYKHAKIGVYGGLFRSLFLYKYAPYLHINRAQVRSLHGETGAGDGKI